MPFIHPDFMLKNKTAKALYHDYAEGLPIIDFHCHLSPAMIAEDHHFKNATELFLGGDHYKWRLMRSNGVDEKLITGDADDLDKWKAFAATLQIAIGHPLYHWTHLELSRYFGVDEVLTPENAEAVFEQVNACLRKENFGTKGLLLQSNVETVCTTDAPGDTLQYHEALKGFSVKILPAFRPALDKVDASIVKHIDYFHEHGCRLSDHAVDDLSDETIETLVFLGKEYAKRGWVMQLHMGALRNNNSREFAALGPDTGCDCASDMLLAEGLVRILDGLEKEDALPKTILYNLTPKDTYTLAILMGSFQKGPTPGKIQLGSGWWFCDQRDGMEAQMRTLANEGLLARFVGMLTDSRSFVSYTRHEYFRRLLCNLIGTWVEDGEFPDDRKVLERIVKGICYQNAKDYFAF